MKSGEGSVATLNQQQKEQFKNVAGVQSLRYQAIALATLGDCGMMNEYANENQKEAIVSFLAKRAENFMGLACDRLGIARPLI